MQEKEHPGLSDIEYLTFHYLANALQSVATDGTGFRETRDPQILHRIERAKQKFYSKLERITRHETMLDGKVNSTYLLKFYDFYACDWANEGTYMGLRRHLRSILPKSINEV